MANKVYRSMDFGPGLNAMFDELCDLSNSIQRSLDGITTPSVVNSWGGTASAVVSTKAKETAAALINTSGLTFQPGEVLGFDSAGLLALANTAASNLVIGSLACLSTAVPGGQFQITSEGKQDLLVEIGVSPSIGDPAWCSAAMNGRVTNAAPTGSCMRVLVGQFVGEKDLATGKAPVILNFSLIPVGSV